MFIGVIAEGKSDLAVISNVLKGKIHVGMEDVVYLQPELDFDETDLHNMSAEQFSNWALVRQTCMEKKNYLIFSALMRKGSLLFT